MQFTVLTDTVPGAPTQQAPSGIIATATPTYTWAAVPGATSYTLYLDNGVTMLRYDTFSASANCSSGTCSAPTTVALTDATSYYWTVEASNAAGNAWAAGMQFTVITDTIPGAPTQQAPSGVISTATPTYTWAAVPGATSYTLYLDNNVTRLRDDPFSASAICSSGTCSVPTIVALPESGMGGFLVEAAEGGSIAPQTAGTAFGITITARDQNNNIIPTFSGTVNLSTNTGSITPVSVTFLGTEGGVLTVPGVTLTQAGTGVTITATTVSAQGTSNGFTVNAAGSGSFLVEAAAGGSIAPQTAGTAFGITITARDQNNNIIPTFSGTVNLSTNTGSITPVSVTFLGTEGGVLTVPGVTLTQAGTGVTITATSGSAQGTSNGFTVNAAGSGSFLVEAADGGSIAPQTAGTAFGITITALDQNNNIIPTFSGTVNLSTNTGSITPVSVTFLGTEGGVFTVPGVTLTLTQAGTGVTITATSGSAQGTSNGFTVTDGAHYYWTVNASNPAGTSPWAAGMKFQVILP
jgi:hypothetical protein